MLNILVIEDNDDHYALIEDALDVDNSEDMGLQHEKELAAGLDALQQKSFDICLCDLGLPDSSVEATIERLETLNTVVPIVVLTSHEDIEQAKSLLQHDVQDYLPKDEITASMLRRICVYAIERKQTQLALQTRNTDMQTFCASLSHDFKAHIRHINSVGAPLQEGLVKRTELNPEELEWFQIIQDSTSSIRTLVDDLGQFLLADHGDARIENVDLTELFRTLLNTVVDTHEQALEIVIQDDWPIIPGNASQLNILFNNLISNGIKYNRDSPRIQVKGEKNAIDGYFEISVIDNGIGIDSEYFPQIFDPFRRLHGVNEYSGTGLGLSIVKRIVERHDGKIHVESKLGEGTVFTIGLPL